MLRMGFCSEEEQAEGLQMPKAIFSSETQRTNSKFSRRLTVYDEEDSLQHALIKHGPVRVF